MASSAAISSFSSRCALVSANLGLAETAGGLLGLGPGLGHVQVGCSGGLTSCAKASWERSPSAKQPAATPDANTARRAGEHIIKPCTGRLHANAKQPFISVGEQG